MNPPILSLAMGKYQGRLGSSALVRQPISEKENSVKHFLNIDPVPHSTQAERLVNRDFAWFLQPLRSSLN